MLEGIVRNAELQGAPQPPASDKAQLELFTANTNLLNDFID
jgi:hypothetical protein